MLLGLGTSLTPLVARNFLTIPWRSRKNRVPSTCLGLLYMSAGENLDPIPVTPLPPWRSTYLGLLYMSAGQNLHTFPVTHLCKKCAYLGLKLFPPGLQALPLRRGEPGHPLLVLSLLPRSALGRALLLLYLYTGKCLCCGYVSFMSIRIRNGNFNVNLDPTYYSGQIWLLNNYFRELLKNLTPDG
jgi:hypothetical protein